MFELVDSAPQSAVIKVIGVGGGGGNAVNHMAKNNIEGVEFICANTDAQALRNASTGKVLQLGGQVTKGLGAGANPDVAGDKDERDGAAEPRAIQIRLGAELMTAWRDRQSMILDRVAAQRTAI